MSVPFTISTDAARQHWRPAPFDSFVGRHLHRMFSEYVRENGRGIFEDDLECGAEILKREGGR